MKVIENVALAFFKSYIAESTIQDQRYMLITGNFDRLTNSMEVLNENVYPDGDASDWELGENTICENSDYPLKITNATGALIEGDDKNLRLIISHRNLISPSLW